MKKKILIIGIIIIIFIYGLFLVTKTLKKENNDGNGSNDNQAKSYEIIDEKANEDYKTLLKIQSGGEILMLIALTLNIKKLIITIK